MFALTVFVLTVTTVLGTQFVSLRLAAQRESDMLATTIAIAYRHSDFYTPDFWREHDEAYAALTWDDTALRMRGDYHGRYFNIVDGWRQVVGALDNSLHTVWLFGSSTAWDWQTPDYYTKASYLQRLFNAAGYRYAVRNMSSEDIPIGEQLRRLATASVSSGDIVVFYDGWHGDGAFERQIAQANALTIAQGAAFFSFLEPYIWSAPLSADEEALMRNTRITPLAYRDEMSQRWAMLRPAVARLRSAGIASYDLTHVLDEARHQGNGVYFDHIHTNERGNETVARAIFDSITIF